MKMIPLALAVIVALAAAVFAWQKNQALEETRVALAGANTQLQKTQAELKSISAEIAPLRKESAEQNAALEQLRAELNTAKVFLESERASMVRLREELAMAKEQIAFMSKTRAAQSGSANPMPVMMIRPATPMRIEAAPSQGTQQRNAVAAPAPAGKAQ